MKRAPPLAMIDGGALLSVENRKSTLSDHRICDQLIGFNIFFVHINPDDGEIFVGFIIINAFFRITAGGIGGEFKFPVQIHASLLLLD